MYKLFQDEEIKLESYEMDIEDKIEEEIENIPDVIDVSLENLGYIQSNLDMILGMKKRLEAIPVTESRYVETLESYESILLSISGNLGVKLTSVAVEDFSNEYALETAVGLIWSNFVKLIKKLWEKIKAFCKKLFLALKILLNKFLYIELQMREYEDKLDKVIAKVSRSSKNTIEPGVIKSNLFIMLNETDREIKDPSWVLTNGYHKVANFNIIFNERFMKIDRTIKDTGNSIKSELNQSNISKGIEYFNTLNVRELNSTLFVNEYAVSSLPDELYDEVLSKTDGEVDVRCLTTERLPCKFNIYYIVASSDKTYKYIVKSYTERNINQNNNIPALIRKEQVLKLYDNYKGMYKDSKIIEKLGDKIESSSKYVIDLNAQIENSMLNIQKNLEKIYMDNLNRPPKFNYDLTGSTITPAISEVDEDGDLKELAPATITLSNNVKMPLSEFNRLADEEKNRDKQADNEQEIKDSIESLSNLNLTFLNFATSLHCLLSEIGNSGAKVYIESKFELLKYLYRSAERF